MRQARRSRVLVAIIDDAESRAKRFILIAIDSSDTQRVRRPPAGVLLLEICAFQQRFHLGARLAIHRILSGEDDKSVAVVCAATGLELTAIERIRTERHDWALRSRNGQKGRAGQQRE